MTTRDPELLLDLFLEEGPAVLPDRVLDAVRDDIHRQRQRTAFGSWRVKTMRTYIAAAAVVAVVALGGGLLLLSRGLGPTVGTTPSPTLTPTPAEAAGSVKAQTTYVWSRLSVPFTFYLPASAPAVNADALGRGGLRLKPAFGGAITVHDAESLPDDLCHPTKVMTQAPRSIEAYLTQSSPDMSVAPTQQLGNIRFWDVTLGRGCSILEPDVPSAGPEIIFSPGEHHRVYAIPIALPGSGDSTTLIAFTWGTGYAGQGDEVLQQVNPLANTVLESIQAAAR
jgi:hypothetical protein